MGLITPQPTALKMRSIGLWLQRTKKNSTLIACSDESAIYIFDNQLLTHSGGRIAKFFVKSAGKIIWI